MPDITRVGRYVEYILSVMHEYCSVIFGIIFIWLGIFTDFICQSDCYIRLRVQTDVRLSIFVVLSYRAANFVLNEISHYNGFDTLAIVLLFKKTGLYYDRRLPVCTGVIDIVSEASFVHRFT